MAQATLHYIKFYQASLIFAIIYSSTYLMYFHSEYDVSYFALSESACLADKYIYSVR